MKELKRKINSTALVLLSGGQDSTTCLFWAKEKFTNITALSFDFGQKNINELECAKHICDLTNIEHIILDLNVMGNLRQSNNFISGRNLFFISFAALVAQQRNIKDIVIGVSQQDFNHFSDCRDAFIKSLNVTLNLGMNFEFFIHTPLIHLNKKETWELADTMGVINIIENNTLTCYEGIPGKGCGACTSCKLRNAGYNEYIESKKIGNLI